MYPTMVPATVDVNLSTVENVEEILRQADLPVSRYYIHKRLKGSGHGTTAARLNRALAYLERMQCIVEGSKGIQWTRSDSPRLAWARAVGRRIG